MSARVLYRATEAALRPPPSATLERDMLTLLRDSRHPGAAAAREQADWLSWQELGGAAPSYLDTCRWTTDLLLEAFPDTTFDGFEDSHIAYVLKRIPPRSRKTRGANLRSWFKWGVKTRRLARNPFDTLPTLKAGPKPLIELYSDAEVAALVKLPHPDGVLMQLLFQSGIRAGEARNLQGRRVDWVRDEILVVDGAKGGKQRRVALEPDLKQRLFDFFQLEGINDQDYLWGTHPGGTPITRRSRPMGETSIKNWWRKAVDDAGLRHLKMHTSRHNYATTMYQRGLRLEEVQLMLGHESIETTRAMYVHLEVGNVAKRLAAIRLTESKQA